MPINNCGKTVINIDITSVLTFKTCASIVIEIIKYLSHQRMQIPYSYDRLKYVVEKKKEKNKLYDDINDSLQSQAYFRNAANAIASLENIFENIYLEFQNQALPNEVCVILGSNTLCAREVYRIIIPQFLHEHFYENHLSCSKTAIHNVLKCLICSEDMQKYINKPLIPTNMNILLKKRLNNDSKFISQHCTSDFFLPIDSLGISSKTPTVIINLNYNLDISLVNCCNRLEIFNDSLLRLGESDTNKNNEKNSELSHIIVWDDQDWFQAKVFLKGFKAVYVNGQSLSNFWVK